jgi:hypothetical protein
MSEPKPLPDRSGSRHQTDGDGVLEIPGDTDAADIVGRTGEEMPEVAHDHGDTELTDVLPTDRVEGAEGYEGDEGDSFDPSAPSVPSAPSTM